MRYVLGAGAMRVGLVLEWAWNLGLWWPAWRLTLWRSVWWVEWAGNLGPQGLVWYTGGLRVSVCSSWPTMGSSQKSGFASAHLVPEFTGLIGSLGSQELTRAAVSCWNCNKPKVWVCRSPCMPTWILGLWEPASTWENRDPHLFSRGNILQSEAEDLLEEAGKSFTVWHRKLI